MGIGHRYGYGSGSVLNKHLAQLANDKLLFDVIPRQLDEAESRCAPWEFRG
jgi:hypothetical protein